jgi:glycosyltransferase involved in cell wall biosynthesis
MLLAAPDPPLHVLFVVRESLERAPGGDTVQVSRTAAALRDLGVRVTILDRLGSPPSDLSSFDCVHLWHLERLHENYASLLEVRRAGSPIVLSPIYWPADAKPLPLSARARFSVRGVAEDLKNVVRFCLARSSVERGAIGVVLKTGWLRARRDLLESASVILPNSHAEAAILSGEAGRRLCLRVVPNAVDPADYRVVDAPGSSRAGLLCVGHFDPRKNQLRLIRALRDCAVDVTFVGGARSVYRRYYGRCLRAAGPRMRFLGPQPASEVRRLMALARVHVCPSHFETPGLVNLEAAAAGCGLALAQSAPVREYFGNEAVYFDSRDISGMRAAVLRSLEIPACRTLRERVLSEFNWSRTAQSSLDAYREALQHASIGAREGAESERYGRDKICAQASTMRARSLRESSG